MEELLEIIEGLTGVAVNIAAQAHGVTLDARTFDRLAHLDAADRALLKLLGPYALRGLPQFFAMLDRFGGWAFAGVLALTWKRKFAEVEALARKTKDDERVSRAREPEFSSVNGALATDSSGAPRA